ncbi:hypothetical protein [Methylomonas albis]|nr:hypothetical protein [Methylomonas albis]
MHVSLKLKNVAWVYPQGIKAQRNPTLEAVVLGYAYRLLRPRVNPTYIIEIIWF